MKALVTGARSPAALDLARDLKAAGIEVHMADSSGARISRWSSAPTAFHRLRPPVQDPAGFRRSIAALVRRLRPAIVAPTCEEVFHLAAAREEGVEVGPLFAPSAADLDLLHAKDRFNALAAALDLDVPETVLLDAPFDPAALDLPRIVLKACYSRFGTSTRVAPTAAEAEAVRPTAGAPWIAQRLVTGVEHSSYAVAVGGRVTAFAAYRSTMRLAGGAGYAFRPAAADVASRLLDATRRIVGRLELTGQISLDAIDDGARSWLLECNPRATSGVHLLAGDGRLARAMTGGAGLATSRPEARRNLPMALSYGLAARRDPGEERGRDVIGAPGDRLPLLGALADTAGFALRAWQHGIGLTAATTLDIEWNGGRK